MAKVDGVELEFELLTFESLSLSSSSSFICFAVLSSSRSDPAAEASPFSPTRGVEAPDLGASSLNDICFDSRIPENGAQHSERTRPMAGPDPRILPEAYTRPGTGTKGVFPEKQNLSTRWQGGAAALLSALK